MDRLKAALVALPLLAGPLAAQNDEGVQRITRELAPQVERVVGLRFRRPPAVAVRSREQLRRYLERKVRADYPPAELRGQERAYKAFALIPDTADLLQLQLDVLQEQVAGFYDPDSTTLFVISGGDPLVLRTVVAHELVHALQDQYTRLNAILKLRRQNDRQMAAQAVMEGQATVSGLLALSPGATVTQLAQGWEQARRAIRDQQESFEQLSRLPLILRESLLFPYVDGADFMIAFEGRRATPEEQPYGDRLPASTEQVLHPSRYTAHELPARLTFPPPARGDTLIYDDDFGEFETRVALRTWSIGEADALVAASGWNGDRYEVLGAPSGTVVLWASAWDTAPDAAEFARALRAGWTRGPGRAAGRRWRVDETTSGGVSLVRLVDAPNAWAGWARVPEVRVERR